MSITPFNSVGGYSTGLTGYTVIDSVGGLSAAGGTFSALTRFTSGISAAGGATFSGTITGATATFSRLTTHSAGITTSSLYVSGGSTFGGNITIPASGSINSNGGRLYIGDDQSATTRVIIGDSSSVANSTSIYLWDGASILDMVNPSGAARMGDPDGINNGAYFIVDNSTSTTTAEIGASEVSVNGLLKPLSGISASGGVTFGGTVASDTGYRITSNAINAQTGTTYTFLSSDNGKVVTFNNASAVTVTIPTALPVGFNCTAIQLGAGQVGFTAASGVTLQSYGNQYRLIGQHASASIIEYSTNIVNLSGNLVV